MKTITVSAVISDYDIYKSRAMILPDSPLAMRVTDLVVMFKYCKTSGAQIVIDNKTIDLKNNEHDDLIILDRDFIGRARKLLNND